MAYWDWPFDASLEETAAAAEFMLRDVEDGEAIYWTARRKSDRRFVGVFDLSDLSSLLPDLGFMIARQFEGQGYAFEATQQVMMEAWKRGVLKLKARIHAGNLRSRRLLERLGFTLAVVPNADVEIRPGVTLVCTFFELSRLPRFRSRVDAKA